MPPSGSLIDMSRGVGKTQQRILDVLAATEHGNLTVVALAERLGASPRQIRQAVHSLAGRELVVLTKEGLGWQGVGEYGPLVRRKSMYNEYGPEVPTATVIREGDPWPWRYGYVAREDTELVHSGMPTGASLLVWLPEDRAKYLETQGQRAETMGQMFGLPGVGARTVEQENAKELPH